MSPDMVDDSSQIRVHWWESFFTL